MSIAEMMQEVIETNYENEQPIRSKYESKIKELNARAEEIVKSGIKDEFGYMIVGLSKLNSMMLDCDQYDLSINPDGEAILVDRVIKVNRYTNSKLLNAHGIDHVVIGGIFLTAPIYLLPAEKIRKAMKNRQKVVMYPEQFGLPSEDVCNYCTLKELSSSVYIAIAKFNNNYINELVWTARNYDYVFLR